MRSGAGPALPRMVGLQARDQVRTNESHFVNIGYLATAAESVRQNALLALLDDPLDAMTLRQLAYTLAGANRPVTVPLLKLADRTSRRDLLTQISLIEFEVESGSASRALRHYDRSLSVNPEMAETLFPILAKATNDPDIRQGLRVYLARPWFRPFLSVALRYGTKPDTILSFFEASGIGLQSESDREFRLQLLNQLVSMEAIEAAGQLMLTAAPTAEKLLEDPSFSPRTIDPAFGPFAWRLSLSEPVRAALVDGQWVEAEIAPGRSGLIAERVTVLPSGPFARTLKTQTDSEPANVRLVIEVRCVGAGTETVLVRRDLLPLSSEVEIAFSVPEDCRAQIWRIMGYGEFGKSSAKIRLGWANAVGAV